MAPKLGFRYGDPQRAYLVKKVPGKKVGCIDELSKLWTDIRRKHKTAWLDEAQVKWDSYCGAQC